MGASTRYNTMFLGALKVEVVRLSQQAGAARQRAAAGQEGWAGIANDLQEEFAAAALTLKDKYGLLFQPPGGFVKTGGN